MAGLPHARVTTVTLRVGWPARALDPLGRAFPLPTRWTPTLGAMTATPYYETDRTCPICGAPDLSCRDFLKAEDDMFRKPAPAKPDVPEHFHADPNNPDLWVADTQVTVTFTPYNAQRTSTVILFPKGCVVTKEVYYKRISAYDGHNIEIKGA